eukprot:1869923-Rhodomonas_salina.2
MLAFDFAAQGASQSSHSTATSARVLSFSGSLQNSTPFLSRTCSSHSLVWTPCSVPLCLLIASLWRNREGHALQTTRESGGEGCRQQQLREVKVSDVVGSPYHVEPLPRTHADVDTSSTPKRKGSWK